MTDHAAEAERSLRVADDALTHLIGQDDDYAIAVAAAFAGIGHWLGAIHQTLTTDNGGYEGLPHGTDEGMTVTNRHGSTHRCCIHCGDPANWPAHHCTTDDHHLHATINHGHPQQHGGQDHIQGARYPEQQQAPHDQ